MNVKIKLSEKLIKDMISRSPNSFLPVNQARLSGKPQSSILWLFRAKEGKKN